MPADSGPAVGAVTLLLGGARSGKSRHALEVARERGGSVLYLATAQALDDEMGERIRRHRAERPVAWHTLEAPSQVGAHLEAWCSRNEWPATVILDCLTLLTANLLLAHAAETPEDLVRRDLESEIETLLRVWRAGARPGDLLLVVSNEVGMGIVPAAPLGRTYRDLLGALNQFVARQADEVLLLVAGLPWRLKPGERVIQTT